MPKVKSATKKSSKKLVSSKKFKLTNFQLFGLLAILGLSGIAIVLGTHASAGRGTVGGPPFIISWVAAHHDKGAGAPGGFWLTLPNGSESSAPQQVQNVNASNDRSGKYLWWGAYHTVTAKKHKIKVCWYYAAPSQKDAHVVFDVTSVVGNQRLVLWSNKSNDTIQHVEHFVYPGKNASTQLSPWAIQTKCTVVNSGELGIKPRDKVPYLEIRAMDKGVAPGDENAFKLWQTTFQVL